MELKGNFIRDRGGGGGGIKSKNPLSRIYGYFLEQHNNSKQQEREKGKRAAK